MVERGKSQENITGQESILTREFIEDLLKCGKAHLLRDQHIATMLFLHLEHGERLVTRLSLPCIHDEKRAYFEFLGKSIRFSGHAIKEAILLAETWIVMANGEEGLTIPPSQHPKRQEAITLTGRNAQNTHFVFAIQPFDRDDQNRPLFGGLEINQFDEVPNPKYYSTGLLDHLFIPVDTSLQ